MGRSYQVIWFLTHRTVWDGQAHVARVTECGRTGLLEFSWRSPVDMAAWFDHWEATGEEAIDAFHRLAEEGEV